MHNTVTLNINGNPQLTITPDQDHVAANTTVTIRWSAGTTGDAFTFPSDAVSGLNGGPFSGMSVTASEISVQDANTPLFGNRDYPYALTVQASNGTRYTANAQNSNPRIHNN